jgi:hypothetical protein
METVNIVDAALAGDKESFMSAFNAAIANKVTDALEVKKVEMASSLITPEVTNEPEEVTTEFDGSGTVEADAESNNDE